MIRIINNKGDIVTIDGEQYKCLLADDEISLFGRWVKHKTGEYYVEYGDYKVFSNDSLIQEVYENKIGQGVIVNG